MLIPLIFGIALGAFTVIFALQNNTVITVTLFNSQIEGSLALILMAAVGMGLLIAFLLTVPESIKNYFRYKKVMKENTNLTEELRKQKELTTFAKKESYTPEVVTPVEEVSAI